MKFITNKISVGKAKSFNDIIKEYQQKTMVKTAEADEAESSGQLDVEPLHQTGESTTLPKNGPSGKKDDTKGTSKSTTNPDEEGKDSGQPKAEGSEKFTNDPKVEKEESSKEGTKTAELTPAQEKLPEALKAKIREKQGDKPEEDGEKKDKKDEDKNEKEDEKKDMAYAQGETKFVKIANLDEKNKTFLRKYWTKLFGEDYVNALLADK